MVNTSLTFSMTASRLPMQPRNFGRRQPFAGPAVAAAAPALGEDLKLFATTWLAGFLFVSLLLA